jgi:hypothetical protein
MVEKDRQFGGRKMVEKDNLSSPIWREEINEMFTNASVEFCNEKIESLLKSLNEAIVLAQSEGGGAEEQKKLLVNLHHKLRLASPAVNPFLNQCFGLEDILKKNNERTDAKRDFTDALKAVDNYNEGSQIGGARKKNKSKKKKLYSKKRYLLKFKSSKKVKNKKTKTKKNKKTKTKKNKKTKKKYI